MKKYPAYKPSGIDWIGEVPEYWEVKKLKYCFELITDQEESDALKIGLEHIESQTGKLNYFEVNYDGQGVTFQPGDILFGKLRPYLAKAWLAEFSGQAVGDFFVFRTKDISSRFGQLVILSEPFIDLCNSSTFGAKMPRVNWEFISNVAIPIPSEHEQLTITSYLDHKTALIDALIEKTTQKIALLQEQRTALINQAVTKGLDPGVPMKDSGVEWIGEMPRHWEVTALKHLCVLLRDGTHLPPPRTDEGVPLLSVRNIVSGRFVTLPDDSTISEEDFQELNRSFVPQNGDVLLAIVGATIGKTAIIENMPPFQIQRSLAIFRPDPNKLSNIQLKYIFESARFQGLLWQSVGFSAQPGIYLTSLSNFRMPVPPIDEQRKITFILGDQTSQIDSLLLKEQQKITLLKEYRQALISEVVTGKIDVRDA